VQEDKHTTGRNKVINLNDINRISRLRRSIDGWLALVAVCAATVGKYMYMNSFARVC
jgi:hypothetical protein